jgi:hypothetical protein
MIPPQTQPFLFIVGSGRSGTSMLAKILSRNKDVAFFRETHFVELLLKKYNWSFPEDTADLARRILTIDSVGIYRRNQLIECADEIQAVQERLAASDPYTAYDVIRECLLLRARQKGKKITGDQTPRHVFYVPELIENIPNALFIFMIRDARDVLLSQKKKWKACQRHNAPFIEVIRSWANYHPIVFSLIWNQANQAGLQANKIYSNAVLSVQFEKLVHAPEKAVAEVCDFLGIQYESCMLDIGIGSSSNFESEQDTGISSKVVGNWKTGLSVGEKWWVNFLCLRMMRKLGYDDMKSLGFPPFGAWIQALTFPFKLGLAMLLNMRRIGNPFSFIMRRLRITLLKRAEG